MHDPVHLEARGNELGHGPDRRVVTLDEGPEELPHLGVGVGEIDVTAPDPLRVAQTTVMIAQVLEDRRGLRVVDDHVVPAVFEQ